MKQNKKLIVEGHKAQLCLLMQIQLQKKKKCFLQLILSCINPSVHI